MQASISEMFKQRPNKRRLLKLVDEEEVNDQDLADALSSQKDDFKPIVEEQIKEVQKPEQASELKAEELGVED
jgi:hypothetical protein